MGAALTAACARRWDGAPSRLARALFAAIVGLPLVANQVAAAQHAVVLEIDGVIGPAVADYVVRELRGVSRADTRLVVLRMNTPGGLDTSMREIIRAILSSPVPVATYVAPSGARGKRRHVYRLCERHRRHGSRHQPRRRHPDSLGRNAGPSRWAAARRPER